MSGVSDVDPNFGGSLLGLLGRAHSRLSVVGGVLADVALCVTAFRFGVWSVVPVDSDAAFVGCKG